MHDDGVRRTDSRPPALPPADPRPRWRRLLESPATVAVANLIGVLVTVDFLFTHVFPLYALLLVWGITGVHALVITLPRGHGIRRGLWLKLRASPFALPTPRQIGVIVVGVVGAFLVLAGVSTAARVLSVPMGGHAALVNLDLSAWTLPVYVAAMLLIVGPVEEFLFRHLLQRRVLSGGIARRVTIAGVAFGAIHAVVYGFDVGAVAPVATLSAIGALLGLAYEATDNLTVPAAIHGVYNAVLFVGLFLSS